MRANHQDQSDDFDADAGQHKRGSRCFRREQREGGERDSPTRQKQQKTKKSQATSPRPMRSHPARTIVTLLKYHSCGKRRDNKEFPNERVIAPLKELIRAKSKTAYSCASAPRGEQKGNCGSCFPAEDSLKKSVPAGKHPKLFFRPWV
jgi:hypothetical protein